MKANSLVKATPAPVARPEGYTSKPPVVDIQLVRVCLNLSCGTSFRAPNRFIRLCDTCRER